MIIQNMYLSYGKKTLDLLVIIITLPVSLPLAVLCAICIKLEEPNTPIFFTQNRIGRYGKTIKIIKFRTMRSNSQTLLEEYLKKNPEEIEHYRIYHKYKNDPRTTTIGKILRKTSLDELPQIINVVKGEMSLVGFRPYLLSGKEKMGDYFKKITQYPPGITGKWQVSGRNNLSFHERLIIESTYTLSIIEDLKILFLTIIAIIKRTEK